VAFVVHRVSGIILAVFLIGQRYLVQGIALTGLKG